jgi:ABC-type nickel/cobalt efflux system permease component RcnA
VLRRIAVGTLLGAVATGLLVSANPGPADAHPLGNFSINQFGALTFHPDRVELRAVVDLAELPTLQNRAAVNAHGGPAYAEQTCQALARGYAVSIGSARISWAIGESSLSYRPGAAGLATSRLTCEMSAPARLDRPATVTVDNTYLADRVGWRELTASGNGVQLRGSAPPTRSVSDELRAYPNDLLASPLDMRSARFQSVPGVDALRTGAAPGRAAGLGAWLGGAEARLRELAGGHLTPWLGMFAVLLAAVLGAAHAAMPGHGKTVMAMYLAGRAGRPRDALAVGATVTLTHTGGVIAVGLLLSGAVSIAGERLLGWLGLASGLLVAAVGAAALGSRLRRRGRHHPHGHDHHHPHGHDHHHPHGHHHHHGPHGHDHHPDTPGRLGLAAIGVAGGLVPSPSALVVLLGAIGLGRTAFGLVLVLAYGVGMAATLTAAGLGLVRLREHLAARSRRAAWWSAPARRLAAALPTASAGAIVLLGTGIAVRAAAGVLG